MFLFTANLLPWIFFVFLYCCFWKCIIIIAPLVSCFAGGYLRFFFYPASSIWSFALSFSDTTVTFHLFFASFYSSNMESATRSYLVLYRTKRHCALGEHVMQAAMDWFATLFAKSSLAFATVRLSIPRKRQSKIIRLKVRLKRSKLNS